MKPPVKTKLNSSHDERTARFLDADDPSAVSPLNPLKENHKTGKTRARIAPCGEPLGRTRNRGYGQTRVKRTDEPLFRH